MTDVPFILESPGSSFDATVYGVEATLKTPSSYERSGFTLVMRWGISDPGDVPLAEREALFQAILDLINNWTGTANNIEMDNVAADMLIVERTPVTPTP